MAAQVHFTVSDVVYSECFERARELGIGVSQYARIVFLKHRNMNLDDFRQAQIEDVDRQERERRERDDVRARQSRPVRRVDGGGYAR